MKHFIAKERYIFALDRRNNEEIINMIKPEYNKLKKIVNEFNIKKMDYGFILKNYLYFFNENNKNKIFVKLLKLSSKFLKGTGYILERKNLTNWELLHKYGHGRVNLSLFNFTSGIFRDVILFKHMVIIENIEKDYRYNTICGIKGIKSTILFPIVINYRVKYVMKWDFTRETYFDYHIVKLLQTLIYIISSKLNIENYIQELKKLGTIDGLTQLYDRNELNRKLDDILKNERHFPFSVLMIDIDDFKRINDTYGHIFGDFVLKELSKILKQNLRIYDLPFRYGGEEFLIILFDTKKEEALKVAERLRKEVEKHVFQDKDIKVHITVTIGISYLDNVIYTKDMIISTADKALYEGKKGGKNQCALYQKKA